MYFEKKSLHVHQGHFIDMYEAVFVNVLFILFTLIGLITNTKPHVTKIVCTDTSVNTVFKTGFVNVRDFYPDQQHHC